MSQVLRDLAPGEQRPDQRVLLHPLQQTIGGHFGPHEVRHQRAHADGEAVAVGVDERVASHLLRDRAVELDRDALALADVKSFLDHLWRQGNDFFDCQRHLVRGDFAGLQAGLLREKRMYAVAQDDGVGIEVAVRPARAHPGHFAVPHDEVLDHGGRDQERARLLGLGCEPAVEFRAQHGERVRDIAVGSRSLVPEGHRGVISRDPQALFDNDTLNGRLGGKRGDEIGEHSAVHHPAHDVLGPGVFPALDQHHAEPGFGHRVGGGAASRPSPNDNRIELLAVCHGDT